MDATVNMSAAAIALNRFGLGATPNSAVPANPKQWLLSQLNAYQPYPKAWQQHRHTAELVTAYYARKQNKMGESQDKKAKMAKRKAFNQTARRGYQSAVRMRMNSALQTQTPFVERLVHFWANHFAISADKAETRYLAGAFELDAIRPHVLGNFKTMLMAVEKHPAMLVYLNQVNSIGPHSKAGIRANQKKPTLNRGLNENLAREIMELHTLGVRSGYTQNDVTAFARALTGWNVQKGKQRRNDIAQANGFAFRSNMHEPGSRTLLQQQYPQQGLSQAEAILSDLAISPHTAKNIATKLVRHFVADNPPRALVEQLTNTFERSQGDLSSVYRELINAVEAWQPAPAKFKSPWAWAVSALRGLDINSIDDEKLAQYFDQLGQPIWKPGSPAGYADTSAAWLSPSALLRRIEVAQRIAKTLGAQADGRTLAPKLLLGGLSQATQTAIARSESATSGLALLFVSPEFLRR